MQLFREIGPLSATFLVVGNIIGIGIFTTTGLIAAEIGNSPWLLGVWVLGGFLSLIGATCYSLLSTRIPQAGGEYAFLYPSYGPFVAFLSGWASLLIGFSGPIAAYALALIAYLGPFLPPQLFEDPLIQK
jgi:APA family basic amino acid/polyamine antiporter